ncbi:sensor histidine kinase [Foetidibacter luteolus]|uniref:sensor histidine kinase n=1 Tax=Foetidibacter luteolus TaxID=2608880 RepID=UPI001A98D314|nr:histidine kinase [Foetidibacter luteolus]
MSVLLNYALFGARYFKELPVFAAAGIVTFIILTLSWMAHGWVAITLRNRLPHESQTNKRLIIAICLFTLMTGITLTMVFWGYDYIGFLGYTLNEKTFTGAYIVGFVSNIFVTLLHEGVSRFENWKTTLLETEQLKKEYLQSQLIGLKSQMRPHFLFNSLNSLSSLINENPEEAEKFLDEMSKVYRYLLKNNEEQLVKVKDELSFLQSYFYILKARHGDGITLEIDVSDAQKEMNIPPLTLQMLAEATFNYNTVSKHSPLTVSITSCDECDVLIQNNRQKRVMNDEDFDKSGIENIINKYKLLSDRHIKFSADEDYHRMQVPLFSNHLSNAV